MGSPPNDSVRKCRILVLVTKGSLPLDLDASRLGAEVVTCADFACGSQLVQRLDPRLVLISADVGSIYQAISFVQQIREESRNLPCVLVTSYSSEELAVHALNAGVTLYFKRPFNEATLLAQIPSLLDRCRPHPPGTHRDRNIDSAGRLIGQSARMRALRDYIRKVGGCQSNVLITGETGTGKELVAELIHANSTRRDGPFVCLNTSAIPDALVESELFGFERGAFTGACASHRGKLALAQTGTVFLDEIGDIGPQIQAKLLRAIEGKKIYRLGGEKEIPLDFRVLAATNQDLRAAVEQNRFRNDLYYRLNVIRIQLAPLRERREDIPALLHHYIAHFNSVFDCEVEGFTTAALGRLVSYDWPGNIRELKNVLEAIFVNLPERRIDVSDLPDSIPIPREGRAKRGERDAIVSALIASNWNKSQAAVRLRCSRMTLYRKMASYQVTQSPVAAGQSAE